MIIWLIAATLGAATVGVGTVLAVRHYRVTHQQTWCLFELTPAQVRWANVSRHSRDTDTTIILPLRCMLGDCSGWQSCSRGPTVEPAD
jgi:hypothetical protein